MDKNKLINSVEKIRIPQNMKQRIIKTCYQEMEIKSMSNNKTTFIKKPIVAVAIIVLCICIASTIVYASSGKLQGYFRDIKNLSGAITGTAYEQATDEINVNIINVSDKLTLEITLLNIDKPPYNCSEAFGINCYSILNANNNTIVKKQSTAQANIVDSTVLIDIPIDDLEHGTHTLLIEEFISSKKADQPLIISGNWKINFTK